MKYFYYFLYYFIACNLPYGNRWKIIGKLSAKFRKLICKKLFAETKGTFSVGKGVDFGYLGHNIYLDDHANRGNFLKIKGNGKIIIGKHIMMGENITILIQDHKYLSPEGYDGYHVGTIKIGDYAWIGDNVIILRRGSIGKHAIIGAGSVVTREIPDYAIAAGNPARVIKYRKQ